MAASPGIRRALVPAAGRGARLDRPGTPKPLVDVGGEALVVRVLRQLEAVGVEEAVVVVGYEAATVVRALTLHPRLSLRVVLVEAPDWERGLAASLLAAEGRLAPPYLIAMADHVFDDRLVARVAAAVPREDEVLALVDEEPARVRDLEAAVKVTVAGERALRFGRVIDRADAVDAGLFAVGCDLFAELAEARARRHDAELADALDALARAGRVRIVATGELAWDDVDTPAALVHAEMRLRHERRVGAVRRTPAPARATATHRFTTGAPAVTEVIVGRGIAFDPTLDLVPDESASSPLFVFTDTTVERLYGERFVGALRGRGYDVQPIVMADGEQAKTLASYARLVEEVLSRGIDERSVLVSLGGGAVCNVCGFLASTLYRGIGLVHVPTTLLGQVDAAISHKQAINGSQGKNLVGSYYAPLKVIVDVDLLATLDGWLIPDGLAECLKHALGQDASFLDELCAHQGDLRDPSFLEAVVRRNIALKCAVMAADAAEHREGLVLLYGHEVGHAVEHLSGYSLGHGQAVAIGMAASARVSRLLGGSDDALVALHDRVLARFELPHRIPPSIRTRDIVAAMRYDKRYLAEGVRMALLSDVGKLWSVGGDYAIPVSEAVLAQALEATR
jgi:3-dehydroquinate synthase